MTNFKILEIFKICVKTLENATNVICKTFEKNIPSSERDLNTPKC